MEKYQNNIIKSLQIVWNNFLTEKNEKNKEHWINVILYIRQDLNEKNIHLEEIESFYNSILSELCSYMLQLVNGIISDSISTNSAEDDLYFLHKDQTKIGLNQNVYTNRVLANTFSGSHNLNLSQLIVGAPSDITAIISLRKFLTHGLGGKILDFLNKCDIKLIASRRNLSNLLLNLFPNSPWNNNDDNDQRHNNNNDKKNEQNFQINTLQLEIENFLKSFRMHEIPVYSKFNCQIYSTSAHVQYQQINNDDDPSTPIYDTLSSFYDEHEKFENDFQIENLAIDSNLFQLFKSKQKTSDEIAVIIIDFLIKLVKEESEFTLDEYSVTVQCIKFGLDNINEIERTNAFNKENSLLLKLKILFLILSCLNNLLARKENLLLFDVRIVFKKLFDCLKNIGEENTNPDQLKLKSESFEFHKYERWNKIFIFEIIFLLFGIINNMMAIFTSNFNISNILDESENKGSTEKLITDNMIMYLKESEVNEELEIKYMDKFKIIVDILLNFIKVVRIFQIDRKSKNKKLKKKQKLKNSTTLYYHHSQDKIIQIKNKQVHCKRNGFPCFFESILIEIFNYLNTNLQGLIMKNFRKMGICCCLYTVDKLKKFFHHEKYETCIQKIIYKFFRYKVLKVIFPKSTNTIVSSSVYQSSLCTCTICEMKLKSNRLHNEIFELYNYKYMNIMKLSRTNLNGMKSFLKHLLKVSHVLTFDISTKILSDIILPIFRNEKLLLAMNNNRPENRNEYDNKNLNIILECLNIFVNYLTDIRLIKGFFIDENIKHLEELMFIPELARTICDLIKIGINNIAYLGDNDVEQTNISKRLLEIQINATYYITKIINDILIRGNNKFLQTDKNFIIMNEINFDNDNNIVINDYDSSKYGNENSTKIENPIKILLNSGKLKSPQLLRLASINWNLTLNLFKDCEQFRNALIEKYQSKIVDNVNNICGDGKQQNMKMNTDIIKICRNQIFQLTFNTLSTFLYYHHIHIENTFTTLKKWKWNCNNTRISSSSSDDNNRFCIYSDSCWPQNDIVFNYYYSAFENEIAHKKLMIDIDIAYAIILSSNRYNIHESTTDIINHKNIICSNVDDSKYNSVLNKSFTYLDYVDDDNDISSSSSSSVINNGIVENGKNLFDDNILLKFCDKIKNNELEIEISNKNHHIRDNTDNYSESIFLKKLKSNKNFCLIYDIRNQYSTKFNNEINNLKNNYNDIINDNNQLHVNNDNNQQPLLLKYFRNFVFFGVNYLFGGDEDKRYSNNFEINSKNFYNLNNNKSLFNNCTGSSSSSNNNDVINNINDGIFEISENETVSMYQSYDSKKYLMQIFECTLAIIVTSDVVVKANKMQILLRKLKALLLLYSEKYWEYENNACAIIHALQSLLKVAEMGRRSHHRGDYNNKRPLLIVRGHDNGEDIILNNNNSTISENSGTDFNSSSKLSCTILDSDEVDDCDGIFSENETEEYCVTADEGYEADAELPEISENNEGIEELWNPYVPSSRYRTTIVHEGICKIVIEILIELSTKCIINPSLWSSSLSQLANRLYVIRESLGGPLFLLKGFSPILKCNDPRLKDFQQSILDLITDLNSPDILSTYFSILASENPPIEILVRYLAYICALGLRIQPKAEIVFPLETNGVLSSTCNPLSFNQIKQYRNTHEYHDLKNAILQSALTVPLDNIKFWHDNGFTVSLWIQVKTCCDLSSESSLLRTAEENEKIPQTHLLSVGSNQFLLNIYINNSLNLVFETSRPCAEIQKQSKLSTTETTLNTTATTTVTSITASKTSANKIKCQAKECNSLCIFRRKRKLQKNSDSQNHQVIGNTPSLENIENISLNQNYPNTSTNSSSNICTVNDKSSSLSNAIQSTKLAIINSFNQFQLFSSQCEGGNSLFEGGSIKLQHYRLPKKKWTHLCFAVDLNNPKVINITTIIDGSDDYVINLPLNLNNSNLQQIIKNEQFQIICLGQNETNNTTSLEQEAQINDDISSKSHEHLEYGLSTAMIFKKCFNKKSMIANLTALGPDCANLTYCQVGNKIPNYGFLNLNKPNIHVENFNESVTILNENLVTSYSALQPNCMISFEKNENGSFEGYRLGTIFYEPGPSMNRIPSIQTSVNLSGGLSSMIYLFARTVELTSDSNTQAFALDLLLGIARSDVDLHSEFIKKDFMNLIGYVIRTNKCTKDVLLLKSLINNSCTKQVIAKRNEGGIHVIGNSSACIIYPNIILSIIRRYSDWYKSGSKESNVLDTLLASIQVLIREKHPHQEYNIFQLQKCGIVKELLNLCKVNVVEAPNPIYISLQAADSFVNILNTFAGSPPSPSLLDEIMKLLLVLHKPNECFVTHDRSKFYFLTIPDPPLKQKILSLPLPSRQFTQIIRERKKRFSNEHLMQNKSSNDKNMDVNNEQQNRNVNKINIQENVYEDGCESASEYMKYENNTIKIPLFENFQTLQSITNCSNLSDKKLFAFNSVKVSRFNSSLFNMKKQRACYEQNKKNISKKISRKRNRILLRINSEYEIGNRKRDKSISESSEKDLDIFTSRGYDVVLSDEVSSLNNSTEPCRRKLKTSSYNKFEYPGCPGIIRLQEKLFLLLKDFLLILPDSIVDEVLIHYIKIEILLVLANNKNTNVRSAIIKLFAVLCDRLPTGEIQAYTKKFYWHHLANQISLNIVDRNLIETIAHWTTGLYVSIDELIRTDNLKIINKFGLNTLIAILPQCLYENNLIIDCFQLIERIYVKVPDCNLYLIENGLIQSIIKTLYKFYSKTKTINQKIEQVIVSLLTIIAQTSIKSIGHINILWELLNLLSFYQENNILNVVEAFRAIQAYILFDLLQSFLPSTTMSISLSRFKSSDLHLQNSQISSSEIKTRFDLLVDRSSQFFITANPAHKPTIEEIKLFELMVPLGTSGNTRCNNFIAWGLLPSRPPELRSSIINSLWKICRGENIPSIVCDGKIIKTLLWLCLTQNKMDTENNEHYNETLCALCRRLDIDLHETWNVDSVLDKLETNRDNCIRDQKPNVDKTIYKYEHIAQSCIDSSMIITRIVTELQNAERKILISQMKEYDESAIFREWIVIIQNMTNEGAPWFCDQIYPKSWELDDTEGPSRVRVRLKRCNLDIDPKFILPGYREPPYPKRRPLDYLITTYDQEVNFSLNSKILYSFTAKYLPLDGEIDGDLLMTDTKLYFVATYKCKFFYIFCNIQNITEIWLRRYQHQEKAFEIFLDSNKSLLFAFQNYEDFKTIRDIFSDKIVQCPDQSKLLIITQQWREGQLTNWEYLMTLNQFAGRTYNDLMQYPVFPWILSNFNSNILDLLDIRNYRKLDKPIAIQHEGSENHYISNYAYINNTITNLGTLQLKPYHYSSHYSNSGTVLHFLVRVPPFTTYFLRYQDNNFDIPDRTFHSINTTWKLASKDSPTDVKELIPEFFCLPEMFENFESFNFGNRQSGEIVNHVDLPPWCGNNPRLFVLIHRQALESEIVRMNLHNWIDLIFGYKQTGLAAIEAVNVFHPATYAEFSVAEISDPIERKAVETMVKTYGQMPKQLLKIPHPPSADLNYSVSEPFVMSSVRGLRWGIFTGSPQLSKPRCLYKYRLAEMAFTTLVSFKNTNVIYGLPEKCCVMQGPESDTYNLISWNYDDNIVRIQPLSERTSHSRSLLFNDLVDEITAYGSNPNSNSLWFGHKSGRISVYQCCTNSDIEKHYIRSRKPSTGIKLSYNSAFRTISFRNNLKLNENDYENRRFSRGSSSDCSNAITWQGPIFLIRHTNEVTSICLSTEFQIAVSVGRDGIAVIWDSNTYSYIRTIEGPFEIKHSPISVVAVSPTLGDILTVHTIEKFGNYSNNKSENNDENECFEVTEENLGDFINISMNVNGKSMIRLHSVNAKYINHYVLEDKKVLSACYSYIKEGTGINVIATGLEDGVVRFWSSWDLSFIQEITVSDSDIISLTYSTYQHLVALSKDNFIHVWESEGIQENSPKFPQIFFNKANSLL